jgi:MFS family permease
VIGQLGEGIAYVRANPTVAWALTYLGVAASIVGILGALGPGFAVHVLNLTSKDFVVVVLPLGFGVVAGVLLVNAIRTLVPRRRTIEVGLVTLGICLVLITIANPISELLQRLSAAQPVMDASALVSVLAVVVAIAFIAGIAYAAIAIPAQTEMQEVIPEDVRGRVFGILNTLVSIGSFLPIIIVGYVSDALGTAPVLLAAACLVGLSGVGSILLRGRQQRMPPPGVEEGIPIPGPSPEEP